MNHAPTQNFLCPPEISRPGEQAGGTVNHAAHSGPAKIFMGRRPLQARQNLYGSPPNPRPANFFMGLAATPGHTTFDNITGPDSTEYNMALPFFEAPRSVLVILLVTYYIKFNYFLGTKTHAVAYQCFAAFDVPDIMSLSNV